jgi:hypothetical protein
MTMDNKSRRFAYRDLMFAGFGWQSIVALGQGEHVVRSGSAQRGYLKAANGVLTLTSRRLVYERVRYSGLLSWLRLFWGHGVDVDAPLSDVTAVNFVPFWKNFRGYPLSGIEVVTSDGNRQRFSLYFARDWVTDIRRQLREKQ